MTESEKKKSSESHMKFNIGMMVVCITHGRYLMRIGQIVKIYSPLTSIYRTVKYKVRFKDGTFRNFEANHLDWPESAQVKARQLLKDLGYAS